MWPGEVSVVECRAGVAVSAWPIAPGEGGVSGACACGCVAGAESSGADRNGVSRDLVPSLLAVAMGTLAASRPSVAVNAAICA